MILALFFLKEGIVYHIVDVKQIKQYNIMELL